MNNHLSLRRALVLAVATTVAAVAVPAVASAAPPKKTNVKVMTRNIYLGANLNPVLTAPNPPALLAGAGEVWRQVQRTNFPGRAALLASEIGRSRPDVVGLQEVAHWQRDINGAPDGPSTPANETVYDFLKLLRSELQAKGLKYKVAVAQDEFVAELPVDNTLPPDSVPDFDAKLTMRDVILVKSRLKTRGAKSLRYSPDNTLQVPTALGVTLLAYRGWTKVDVIKKRMKVRVFNTHLEAFDGDIRLGQAQELAGRDELRGRRLILLGDLNSDPDGGSPDAYNVFTEDGFRDVGVTVNTCCHEDELRNAPPAAFTSRIDHVLARGKVKRLGASLIGSQDAVFGELGIWPSDHGGVVSRVRVRR